MKNTIANIVHLPAEKLQKGLYGLEIEAEGDNLPMNGLAGIWRLEADGSLQSGYKALEYVMNIPSSMLGVKSALDVLNIAYKAHGTVVYDTQTSGVHVHMNVQNYTPKELFTLMTVYFILEELLITYCGPNREGNHFCLRIKDAEWLMHELVQAAQTRKFNNLKTDDLRYSTLNSCSLFKYGSLEFRAMRGTGNLNAIYEWVEILDRVREAALKYDSPREVVLSMSESGEDEYLNKILGDKAKLFYVPERKRMIREGARLVQALAFLPQWNEYKDIKVNPFA